MTSKNNPFYPLQEVDDTISNKRKLFLPRTPSNSPPRMRNPSNIIDNDKCFKQYDKNISKYENKPI